MATNSNVTVKNSSTSVLAINKNRRLAIIVNDSDQVIYLALGGDAELNKGIRLNAGGGSLEINASQMFRGAINAICSSGGKRLCFTETRKEAS